MAQSFRIFTNDRDWERGVPMYSAFTTIKASDAESALAKALAKRQWPRNPGGAPAVAIEWPPVTAQSKAWLSKHVGD